MVGIITSHSGLRPEAKRYIMAGRGVVVDIAGRGDFTTVQDACDYMKARDIDGGPGGPGHVWIRAGTYAGFSTNQNETRFEGESWDTIIDGGTDSHAIDCQSFQCQFENLTVKTTAGGGTSYNAVNMAGGYCHMLRLQVTNSDNDGILCTGYNNVIDGCKLDTADRYSLASSYYSNIMVNNLCGGDTGATYAIALLSGADRGVVAQNYANSAILINSGADSNVVQGNTIDRAVSDSGTSNDLTGNNVVW